MDYLKYRKIVATATLIIAVSIPVGEVFYSKYEEYRKSQTGLYDPSYEEFCLTEIFNQCRRPVDMPQNEYRTDSAISSGVSMAGISATATIDYGLR